MKTNKRTFLTLLLALGCTQSALAMEEEINASKNQHQLQDFADRDQIVRDFLHDHEKFQSLWSTQTGTCYHALPKDVAHIIAKQVVAPAFTMLKKGMSKPDTTIKHSQYTKEIRDASFNQNSTLLATASDERNAKIWDIKTGNCLHTLRHNHNVLGVAFGPDGTLLATASQDNTAKIWDLQTGNCLLTLNHPETTRSVFSTAFNESCTQLLTTAVDGIVRIWDMKTGLCVRAFKPDSTSNAVTAKFHKNNTQLITNVENCTKINGPQKITQIWDIEAGTCLQTEMNSNATSENDKQDESFSLRVNTRVVYASKARKNIIEIWDRKTDTCIFTIDDHSDYISSVQLNPTSDLLVASCDDTAKIWNIGKILEALRFYENKLTLEQAILINCIFQTAFANQLIEKRGLSANNKFDLNKFPHLLPYFESLPQEIQEVLAEYVGLNEKQTSPEGHGGYYENN